MMSNLNTHGAGLEISRAESTALQKVPADRRNSFRAPCNAPVYLTPRGTAGISCRLRDLGEQGAAILAPIALSSGTICQISMQLLVDGVRFKLALNGCVVSCVFLRDSVRIGLRFEHVSATDKSLLKRWLALHGGGRMTQD